MGSWSPNLTVRYNQDNQRDFEEKAAAQMVALLTKRTMLEYNLRSKNHSYSKSASWNSSVQPIGNYLIALFFEMITIKNLNLLF